MSDLKTLESYFRIDEARQVIDHSVRVQMRGPHVTFYIHPSGVNGETPSFWVINNELREIPDSKSCNHSIDKIYGFPITNATTGRSVSGRYCICGRNMLPDLKP